MTTYLELEQQAAELMRQAEEIRAEQRQAVLQNVREAVQEWNITVAELGLRAKANDKRSKVAAKYQHPDTGKTWSGRGKMPSWMAAALQAGASKEQFLI